MELVQDLHHLLAWVVIFAAAIAGTWATVAHWVVSARGSLLWLAQHVMHALVMLQVVFGSVIVGFSDVEAGQSHMFYGFLCFAGVGLIVSYRHLSEYRYLLYGLGGLFIMGLAIRALLLNPLA